MNANLMDQLGSRLKGWLSCAFLYGALALTGCETVTLPAHQPGPVQWPEREAPSSVKVAKQTGDVPIQHFGDHGQCAASGYWSDGLAALFMTVSQVDRRKAEAFQGTKGSMSFTPDGGTTSSAELDAARGQMPTMVWVSEAAEPIGTVFLLSSLSLLSAGESKLIKAFHERSWTVVVVTPCLDVLSLTHLKVPHEIPPSLLGRQINNHLAERAYAAESAWSLLAKRRPKHKALPKVICGVSLGALAAPAVALRLQDAEALITIGGGAHVPAIMANSALRMLSMPSASQRRTLSQRILREVPLDPGILAPRLDLPVLQIDGMLDTIIPKRFANRWHEALGRPDRWRYPVGHVLLIEGIMPLQTNRLLDWVATATED